MASYTSVFDSDSDGEEFEGFGPSDIESDISLDSSETESSDDSDDDDVPLANLIAWTDTFTEKEVKDFTSDRGPVLPDGFDTATSSALDYFWLLFSPMMFGLIACFTNSYAKWKQTKVNKRDPDWRETTAEEMRAFVGMNILMGINTLPDVRMYWSKDQYIGNQGISDIMTCNRYGKLNQYFHVSDRDSEPQRGTPNYDRLFKVRPILDHVSDSFLAKYQLGRDVSVDEAMIRYTGKLSFRQYMPAKPIKRGIKIWMACDANSAYLSRFEVYLGKQTEEAEHGLGYRVVRGLTDNLHNTFRHIYFDNFFTSVPLLQGLLVDGLYACGTLRANRKGIPQEIKKPKDVKNRGDYMVMQKGNSELIVTAWKDKKLVHHLSTLNSPTDIKECTRRIQDRLVPLRQPSTVYSYNKFMGGVDRHDQLRMKYDVGRNSKKWWRYLFWFFINCCIVNAFIIYKEVSRRRTKKEYSHLDFRIELARDLIAGFTTRKRKAPQMDFCLVEQENVGGHINTRLPGTKGRCTYHRTQLNKRKETVYGCSVCRVHLCRDGCHRLFHSMTRGDLQ